MVKSEAQSGTFQKMVAKWINLFGTWGGGKYKIDKNNVITSVFGFFIPYFHMTLINKN